MADLNAQDEAVKKAQEELRKQAASEPAPMADGSVPEKPSMTAGEITSAIGRGVWSAGTGAAEILNPLSIPSGIENITRTIINWKDQPEDASFMQKLSGASQKANEESVLPNFNANEYGAKIRGGLRALPDVARAAFGDDEAAARASQIMDEERKTQANYANNFEIPAVREGTQLAIGIAGLAGLAKTLGTAGIKGVQNFARISEQGAKIAGEAASAATKEAKPGLVNLVQRADELLGDLGNPANSAVKSGKKLEQAKQLQQQLLKNVPDEVKNAIFQNTSDVKKMLQDARSGKTDLNSFDVVQKTREQLQSSKDILGTAVNEFRKTLASDRSTKFDTESLAPQFEKFLSGNKTSYGANLLDPRDERFVNEISDLILNPTAEVGKTGKVNIATNRNLTAGDVIGIQEKIGEKLKPTTLWGGANSPTRGDQFLNDLWHTLDSGLQDIYPGYKETKVLYQQHLDAVDKVLPKLESMNAESFLNGIFGANKTELRGQLESALNYGNEAAKGLSKISTEANAATKSLSTSQSANIQRIADMAKDIKSQPAKEFFNEIANRNAAKRLRDVEGPDSQLDTIDRLVKDYARPKVKFGASAGSLLGYALSKAVNADSLLGGGTFITVGGGAGAGLADIVATNRGKQLYSVDRLFKLIESNKQATPSLKKLANDAAMVYQKYGEAAGKKFLDMAQVDQKDAGILQKILAASTPVINSEKAMGGSNAK